MMSGHNDGLSRLTVSTCTINSNKTTTHPLFIVTKQHTTTNTLTAMTIELPFSSACTHVRVYTVTIATVVSYFYLKYVCEEVYIYINNYIYISSIFKV